MRFLLHLPMKHKLMVITMVAGVSVLAVAVAAGLIFGPWIGLLTSLVGGTLVFLQAAWLRTAIAPLSALANTVATARATHNYALRAVPPGSAELDSLVDGFNDLLAQIQERDANVEGRVKERTGKLAKSLSVLDAALSSTADGIIVVDLEGKRIFQNRRAAELWKIPANAPATDDDAAQIQQVAELVANPSEFKARIAYLYAHPNEPGRDEVELKDGTILERTTAPVLDQEGHNYGRLWTFRDVTQARKNEAALRISEANYYSLVDQIPAGIFRKDQEGRYVFVNSYFCRMHDAQPEDYLGKLPQELPPELEYGPGAAVDDAKMAAAKRQHESIMATGRQVEAVESHRCRDGRIQHFHAVMSPVIAAGGAITGTQGFLFDITQRKQAEAAVAESELLLRSIMENSREVIFVKDRQCRFVYMNPAGYRFAGATPEKLLGRSKADFHPDPVEAEQFMVDDRRVMEVTLAEQLEETLGAPDGSKHVFLTTKVARRDGQGQVIGLIGIAHDITERKRAEQALRESEAKYYSLVDQMPAGIFRKDLEGRFVLVNSSYCRLKQGKPEDFLGKMPLETVASGPAAADSNATALAAAGTQHHAEIVRTGRQMEFDEKQTGEDGKTIYIHSIKSAVYGPDGAIVGSQGVLLDVTQRRQAEAALAYERDLLKALLDSSPDSIYFKDRQARYVRQSQSEVKNLHRIALGRHRQQQAGNSENPLPAHLTSLELFREYLVGKSDVDVYGPEKAAEYFKDEQEIMQSGTPVMGKVEQMDGPDGPVWFITTKSAWRNREGEVIGLFGTSQNITKLKEAEAQVEHTHHQLMETSRLAGMAEVATSVLHNVGNVLNSVNVSTTLVLELVRKSRLNHLDRLAALIREHSGDLAAFLTTDPRGKEVPAYLSNLAEHLVREQAQLVAEVELTGKNIEHIKDIVSMQQDYAKFSGLVEKVKVTDLVEDALRMNTGALNRHQVQVVRNYPAELIECQTERQKVLQILVNLIRNAKYACDESGRPDKCLTVQVCARGGQVEISVVDNGVGIPAENLTRIFNHGFTTRVGGHGFGLHSGAIAAKELGGSLLAYSDGPGAGARFVLELPLPPGEA